MYSIVKSSGQKHQTDFKQSVIFDMISLNCEIYRLDDSRKMQLIGILNEKTYIYILFKSLKICLKDYFDKEFSEGLAESMSIIEDWLSSDRLIDSERFTQIYNQIGCYCLKSHDKNFNIYSFHIYSSIYNILGMTHSKSSIAYKCAKDQFISYKILSATGFDPKFKRKAGTFIVKFLTSGENLFLL